MLPAFLASLDTALPSALTLGLPYWVVTLLVLGFLIVCLILILTVLIQKPQGGGLSGAFGAGGGSGQTAFGAKTGDALTIATIGMFVVFLLYAIGLNFAARPSNLDAAPVQPIVESLDGEETDESSDAEQADPGQTELGSTPEVTPPAPAETDPATSPATGPAVESDGDGSGSDTDEEQP